MTLQDFIDGLRGLGFTSGFALNGDPVQIVIWEHEQPQPTDDAIEAAIPAGKYARQVELVQVARHAAYTAPDGSDALFMKFQRNEDGVTKQAWLDRIAEINAAHPYPEPPVK